MNEFEREVIDRLARMETKLDGHINSQCDDCKLNDRFISVEQWVKWGRWVLGAMGLLWLQELARTAITHFKG